MGMVLVSYECEFDAWITKLASLGKSEFPDHEYLSLEAPDVRSQAMEHPRGFWVGQIGSSWTRWSAYRASVSDCASPPLCRVPKRVRR